MRVATAARSRLGEPRRVYLIGARVAAAAIAAVWLIVAARLLPLGDFADLALISALSAIAVQLADLGVGIQLPIAFTGTDSGMPVAAVRQAFLRRLTGSAATVPFLIAAFTAVAATRSLTVAAGFAVSAVATSVYGAGYVALRSADAYGLETVLEPGGRLVVLALGTALAASGHGLGPIAWSYALADLLVLAVVALAVAARCRGRSGGPQLGRVSWLVAAGPVGMLYWRADIWLLAALATSRQVALYGSSYRLLDAALLPALVVAQLFPAPFARATADERRALLVRWVRAAVCLMLPFTVLASFLARPVLTLVFGHEFAGAAVPLVWLAFAAPLTAAAFILTTTLATLDPRAYIGAAVIALAVNVGGNLLLAPAFGASGAAAVTVLSQSLLVAVLWTRVSRRLPAH